MRRVVESEFGKVAGRTLWALVRVMESHWNVLSRGSDETRIVLKGLMWLLCGELIIGGQEQK